MRDEIEMEKKQIVALLADATYFEIGKSKNHLMQRIREE